VLAQVDVGGAVQRVLVEDAVLKGGADKPGWGCALDEGAAADGDVLAGR
jgi:hypothetical protein